MQLEATKKAAELFPNLEESDIINLTEDDVDPEAGYAGAAFTEVEDDEEWIDWVDWDNVEAEAEASICLMETVRGAWHVLCASYKGAPMAATGKRAGARAIGGASRCGTGECAWSEGRLHDICTTLLSRTVHCMYR